MAAASATTRLTALRRAIRNQNASPEKCLDFMKTFGMVRKDETSGELLNAADCLETLTCLRNELCLDEAVTFLKMYLDWLREGACKDWLYLVEIGFLLADDLVELLRISEAQDEYKQILECIGKYGSCKSAEALAISKLAVLAYRLDSKPEGKQYYRRCFEIIQGIMEQKEKGCLCMSDVELKFAMDAFRSCGEFLRHLGKYDSAGKFFLKALDYCPQNADVVINRYSIYVELYRNELSINNFLLPGPLNMMPTAYDDMTVGHRQSFLREGNFKNMKEFMRCYSIICVCQTIRCLILGPLTEDLKRSSYHQVLLSDSQKSLDENKPSIFMALKLALCSRMKFEMGHLDFRKFTEQAEKHVDGWMAQLNQKPPKFGEANLFKYVLFLILESYVREQNYVEAEKRVRKALDLSYTDKPFCGIQSLYIEFKADVQFLCACMYCFWRGHCSMVKAFSKLALKYFKKTNNQEKVIVLECLLESLKLPD